LPKLLIAHFDIVKHDSDKEVLHLYFEKKKDVPKEFSSAMTIAHGFHKETTIQDFPVRGKKVFLHIIINDKGEILSFTITQASEDDRTPLKQERF
jgi:hypothetical protein